MSSPDLLFLESFALLYMHISLSRYGDGTGHSGSLCAAFPLPGFSAPKPQRMLFSMPGNHWYLCRGQSLLHHWNFPKLTAFQSE